jgi:hypothetical protein
MQFKLGGRSALAGIAVGALMGAGLVTVTPAGAVVQDAAAAINWKNIWQTQIKPRADKRYYTKKKANARFYTQVQANSLFETKAAHDASLLNYYTKAQSDTNYYTKAQSDAKYAPAVPALIRGVTIQGTVAAGAGQQAAADISFGVTLSAAPTVHYIAIGSPVPPGCSGTAAAPNAQAGNLCIFEVFSSNNTGNLVVQPSGALGATATGALLFATSVAAGQMVITTSWAVRPAGLAPIAAPIAKSLTPRRGGPFLR